jgi:hypothetical protein
MFHSLYQQEIPIYRIEKYTTSTASTLAQQGRLRDQTKCHAKMQRKSEVLGKTLLRRSKFIKGRYTVLKKGKNQSNVDK